MKTVAHGAPVADGLGEFKSQVVKLFCLESSPIATIVAPTNVLLSDSE